MIAIYKLFNNGIYANQMELVAVAPLEMRQEVTIAISKRNAEAIEAGMNFVFKYDLTAANILQPGKQINL